MELQAEDYKATAIHADRRLAPKGWCLTSCQRQGTRWTATATESGSGKRVEYVDHGSLAGVLDNLVRLVEMKSYDL